MGIPTNMLSEKTKAKIVDDCVRPKIVDDCVRLGKAVLTVLLSEMSQILGEYSKNISEKSSTDCCKKMTIKENEAK